MFPHGCSNCIDVVADTVDHGAQPHVGPSDPIDSLVVRRACPDVVLAAEEKLDPSGSWVAVLGLAHRTGTHVVDRPAIGGRPIARTGESCGERPMVRKVDVAMTHHIRTRLDRKAGQQRLLAIGQQILVDLARRPVDEQDPGVFLGKFDLLRK